MAKKDALREMLDSIQKKHGAGSVMMNDGSGSVQVESIPTGSLPLDLALGIGGFPRGRIIEIFGPEASGKTTLLYHMIANSQKAGLTCAFVDAEHSVDPVYASRIGVDFDNMPFSQPDHGEQGLEIASAMIDSGLVKVVAIDSVAALVPKAEIEGEIGDSFVGLQARLMSQALRKLSGSAKKQNATVIFTNQLREKIGVMFGSPEVTPGGRALKFYSSIRMDIRRIETIKDKEEAIAQKVRIKVVKNKVAPPNKQAEFPIRYGIGVDRAGILMAYATDDKNRVAPLPKDITFNLVDKSGAYYTFPNGDKIQGVENARQYLADNPDLMDELEAKIKAKLAGEDDSSNDSEEAAEAA